MKILTKEEKKELVDCAMDRIDCDLIITDANIFNVFTKETYPGEIYIKNGYIAYIEQRKEYFGKGKTKKSYSAKNKIVVPGFIDSHMHIESSMLTPQNFSTVVIPKGTTTVVTDPHEIGNVMGIEGVEYMIEAGKHTYMNQYILAPSCVPAVPGLETSGAVFNAPEIEYLLDKENVLGLAEVMDYYGVLNNSQRMTDILEVAEKKNVFIQGHFFGEDPREISAYLCAGPQSNHEFYTGKDALQALRYGMVVDARDSSFARNIDCLVNAVKDIDTFDRMTLCTDDKEPEELLKRGHLDDCIRSAISSGRSFEETIKSVTIIPALQFKLKHIGAIAPGYVANLNFIENKNDVRVSDVFFEGVLVAKDNKMVKEFEKYTNSVETKNTVFVDNFDCSNLKIKAPIENGTIKTTVIEYESLDSSITKQKIVELPVKDGFLSLEGHEELNFIAVVNRHKNCDNYFVGVTEKFHLNEGALAGTVSHDSHNLTVVFNDIEDAKTAIEEIKKLKGGVVYVHENKLEKVALPIAGLLSNLDPEELVPKVKRMNEFLKEVGIKNENPIMRLFTAALPVVPTIKITDMGLVDTINQKFLNLFV